MERYIKKELKKWKESNSRKPLLLEGARQVGKTYVLKEFARENYEDMVYANFDYELDLKKIFENTHKPEEIIKNLSFFAGKNISPEKTLIILDEIQECPDALISLKYFNEMAKEYHIACAGSLLGVKTSSKGFPVGQVDFLNMYPMTFTEFLLADGKENLVNYINRLNKIEAIPEDMSNELNDELKTFFIVGGMPAVVSSWIKSKDINEVNRIQEQILTGYKNDFLKHSSTDDMKSKISLVWDCIESQLAKENKTFVSNKIDSGKKSLNYYLSAINWLSNSRIVNEVYNISAPKFPTSAYINFDQFKLYMSDVGLLRKKSNLKSSIILEGNNLYSEFKGALAENFILNELIAKSQRMPNYYSFSGNEIDFIIEKENKIIPIEVKSGKSNTNNSLTIFNKKYDPEISIRFSLKNLNRREKILNIPLFMVEYIDKFYELAREEIKQENLEKEFYKNFPTFDEKIADYLKIEKNKENITENEILKEEKEILGEYIKKCKKENIMEEDYSILAKEFCKENSLSPFEEQKITKMIKNVILQVETQEKNTQNNINDFIEQNKFALSYLYDKIKYEDYFDKCYNNEKDLNLDDIKQDIKENRIFTITSNDNKYVIYKNGDIKIGVNAKTNDYITGEALEKIIDNSPVE